MITEINYSLSPLNTTKLHLLVDGTATTLSTLAETDHYISKSITIMREISSNGPIFKDDYSKELFHSIKEMSDSIDATLHLIQSLLSINIALEIYDEAKADASLQILDLINKEIPTIFDEGYIGNIPQVEIFLNSLYEDEYAEARVASDTAAIFDTLWEQFSSLQNLLESTAGAEEQLQHVIGQNNSLRRRLNSLLHYIHTNYEDDTMGFSEVVPQLQKLLNTVLDNSVLPTEMLCS